jgi:hypothetical protein
MTEDFGSSDCSSSIYVPAWKDESGNRIIFLSESDIQESSGMAYARQMQAYPFFRQVGLSMDGVQKVEVKEDGGYSIPHVDVTLGPWTGHCVGGPIFEAAS